MARPVAELEDGVRLWFRLGSVRPERCLPAPSQRVFFAGAGQGTVRDIARAILIPETGRGEELASSPGAPAGSSSPRPSRQPLFRHFDGITR